VHPRVTSDTDHDSRHPAMPLACSQPGCRLLLTPPPSSLLPPPPSFLYPTYWLACSACGKLALTAGGVREVWVWDIRTCQPIRRLIGSGVETVCASFRYILLSAYPPISPVPASGNLATRALAEALTPVGTSPAGNEVLSGSLDGALRIFDMCGRLRETAHLHAAPVSSCRYTRRGAHLVSCGLDGSALVVDAFDWSVVGRWVSSSSLTAIDSADIKGGRLAFGDECGTITQLSAQVGICGKWRSF
jgi:WD40 repeat protein